MNKQVLILIDIQKEYTTQGRPFFLSAIGPSLENAKRCLEWARKCDIPVIHVKHVQSSGIFSADGAYTDFVNGYEPLAGERTAIKANFSSFSSPEFKTWLADYVDHEIILVGYGSTMCVLSTAIEAYHRGYIVTVVSDATAAKGTVRFDELSTHQYALDILSTFAKIKKASEVIAG